MHFYDSKWLLRKHRNLSTNRQQKPGITRKSRKCRYIQRSQRPKKPGITRNHRKTHTDSEPENDPESPRITRNHPDSHKNAYIQRPPDSPDGITNRKSLASQSDRRRIARDLFNKGGRSRLSPARFHYQK